MSHEETQCINPRGRDLVLDGGVIRTYLAKTELAQLRARLGGTQRQQNERATRIRNIMSYFVIPKWSPVQMDNEVN